jgi:hypothetical protein
VLRVYLDQKIWIPLARAFSSHPLDPIEEEILALAQAAANLGLMSFPLSSVHYIETYTARDPARRRRLAEVMQDVSKFHTIAPEDLLLPPEVDEALYRRFGRPATRRTHQVFGVGVAHAFGEPDGVPPPRFRRHPEGVKLVQLWEFYSLAGPQPEIELSETVDMESWKKPALDFADAQIRFAEQLEEVDYGTERRSDAVAAQELLNLMDVALRSAMARVGIPEAAIYDQGKEGLTEFLEDVPTRDVALHLRAYRHSMPQKPWTRTDLADIGALAIAVPYCDAVVTEAVWVDGLRRADLDKKYDTTLMSSLSELRTFLVETVA